MRQYADCSDSLTDAGFNSPAPIPYNSAGSTNVAVSGFAAVFTHTKQTDCPLTTCRLKQQGCSSDLPSQPNVILGSSAPFGITAKETVSLGYSLSFCYECEVTPIGKTPVKFTKDSIVVSQNMLDCSVSLTNKNSWSTAPFVFNKNNNDGSLKAILGSYKVIFSHINEIDCPLTTCRLKQQGCNAALTS